MFSAKMIKTKSYIFLTIVMFLILFTQVNCHTEYKNAPEVCAFLIVDDQALLENDKVLLNKGEITQEEFEHRKRSRENGSLGLCLISLIKTKENSNF
ncbi:SHOCT domain-containing protein [Leptospira kanakyensis]|uniref:SHOCT domain-containing protein n=1 Tax=Leptospira kanakyensis TaxID=2484968 RepID=A0A6N4Q5B7_9LEPT|nr:SHOCT domain-containing protein [Leptospira kanakyensis]MCW7483296.1 SHOCT domain-containing protein [Leptospira kanakyensis]TGK53859.1 SHOCT domain-containing protein [Leptospira kanakyensis]TGK57654.1 SHOCT domain-containing protein [Leptospira kanakyensis]TGK73364.1 SHOCT domain-containing protein [Leptospira kanakyensis]